MQRCTWKRPIDEKTIELIRKLKGEGLTYRQIGQRLGYHYDTISRLAREGIKVKSNA